MRKRLIDDLAHKLNTPLSFIRLEATGLRDGLQAPAQAADNVIQKVNTLRYLVRDLNWLAETDSGQLQLEVEACSLYSFLAVEVERWQSQAQARQVALSLQAMPDLPTLELDRKRMSQALGNLLRNALQHTDAGGQVTVAAQIESACEGSNPCVTVTVTDNGAGIDPSDLPYVFDRFYRADLSRNRVTGGTGLGLAIARVIVEAHRGTIAVTSDGIGKGTTVQIDLPLH